MKNIFLQFNAGYHRVHWKIQNKIPTVDVIVGLTILSNIAAAMFSFLTYKYCHQFGLKNILISTKKISYILSANDKWIFK